MIVIKEKNVAKNPVARAIAAQQLKKRMLDHRIQLLMLDEDIDARAHILPISDAIFIMAYAYELMKQEDCVEYRKLKSAMLTLTNCSERRFTWHKADAITIDNAISICVDNWRKVPTSVLYEAIQHITSTMN
jgi:hypothetical protein